MDILILGGTGAMGRPLVKILSQSNKVVVTTRKDRQSEDPNLHYFIGNAKDLSFLKSLLSQQHWDVVIDFMVWTTEFPQVAPMMLETTDQYVFISSARVYAQSDDAITEKSPRLLDVSEDEEYLKTNEYALAKAREEDILLKSGKKNFTIIRPTITYNNNRLQLGVLEKENWLYRVLHGRSIVFSEDIASKLTTMTFGDDVAGGIASLVGKREACGEVFHITCPEALLWSDVLETYLDVLEGHLGYRPKVVMTEKCTNLQFPANVYQVIYCRYFNRRFDNTKISKFCDVSKFTKPHDGLANCLNRFLSNPHFDNINWRLEAANDKAAGERTPLSEIPSWGNRLNYIAYRYDAMFLLKILNALVEIKNRAIEN